MSVAVLPTTPNVDAAWERYRALAQAALDDPRLTVDRDHVQRTILAHKEFGDLFLDWVERL